ncbi:MAG: DNRLRE domain-containing protein [Chloroflexi bacterium]|nr:DNRLRE domain-containing protein [Chloroflexota bacterium]
MWTNGPLEPDVAARAEHELKGKGMNVVVSAQSYGETDSCGTYSRHGVDFTITFPAIEHMNPRAQQEFAENVVPVLVEHGKPNLGKVNFVTSLREVIPVDLYPSLSAESASTETTLTAVVKNVYVIAYDPLLSNGQKLSEYMNWSDHSLLTLQTVNFFAQNSNNRISYNIVDTTVVTSGWPELIDGFSYTESEYMAVWNNPSLHHEPTTVNYNKIVNSPDFDICGRLNRGEIDEVWIYNGPWFGFYESRLVGPGAYYMNSGPVTGSHNCNKILPIMGPSVERTVSEAVHNFTHRTESTMSQVYGGWAQNRTDHNWDRFGLVKAQSPDYSYSGCGSSHYPPNGTSDYDYGNVSSVPSNCADFANYPNLGDPLVISQPVTCSDWGCLGLDYYDYWYNHVPFNPGCGPDNVSTDWWSYLGNPGMALYPSYACQTDMHIISGNAGTGNVTLSYIDGIAKTVQTDSYGNYFLLVSNHWTGTIIPSKTGTYVFTPASRSYSDVQGDQYSQGYSAEGTDAITYYVDVAAGNNGNSCTAVATPCHDIQETVNKAKAGDIIYVANGTYLFSTNPSPNVVIINKDLALSGGWNSDFSSQAGQSIIDGANVNNGLLAVSGNILVENFNIRNSRSSDSGAIYIVNGIFTLSKSTLNNNLATSRGAGIFLANGVVNVINSTISGNQAFDKGGGIYVSGSSGGVANIQNSTIAYNTAYQGGGVAQSVSTYNVANTIIANNSATNSSPDCLGTLATANNNIVENMAGCSITNGIGNLNVDPNTSPNLTGTMSVHTLLSGSPAIDAGTSSGCPSTDQQGTARPQGTACEIGAVEYIPVAFPSVTSIVRADPNPTVAANVNFTVTFSESVTGVDADDFQLVTSGVSGALVSGVTGMGSVYTVTVSRGSGSGTIRLDLTDNDSILNAALEPLGGVGVDNGDFTQGESYTIPVVQTLSLGSAGTTDGWVLESSETSGVGGTLNYNSNTFNLGDDKSNKQYVTILSFDTSTLPDTANILSVTLKIKQNGITGTNPFTTHGNLMADIKSSFFGSNVNLAVDDFQAPAGVASAGSFGNTPTDNWYSAALNNGFVEVNLNSTTQFRIYFELDDDNDKIADYMKFYSGNASTANRPQLIIQYYVP